MRKRPLTFAADTQFGGRLLVGVRSCISISSSMLLALYVRLWLSFADVSTDFATLLRRIVLVDELGDEA